MGISKKLLQERQELVRSAVQALVEAEYGEMCEKHDEEYIFTGQESDLEDAIEKASQSEEWSGLGRKEIEEIFNEAANVFGVNCVDEMDDD